MKRKLLLTILGAATAACMAFGIAACDFGFGSEHTSYEEFEGLRFELNEDGESYSVVGIGKIDSDIIIPSTYNDKPVTSIGDAAFSSRINNLASIVIPDSVTSIGASAFTDCESLTSVVIGNGVTEIGEEAFSSCYSLKNITIGDSVTSIGKRAFAQCTSLTSIVIPESMTFISEWAFRFCYKLIEVWNHSPLEITQGSESNGCVAYYAKNVYSTNAESKQSLTDDGYIFYEDETDSYLMGHVGKETDLILPPTSPLGKSYEIYQYAFFRSLNLISVVISDNATSILEGAFSQCINLTRVVISDEVTSIGNFAFELCTELTSIVMPKSVTLIASNLFSYCSSLKSIEIPDGVTKIESGAFSDCSSLTSIVIPDSVTLIGQGAFYNCSSLTSIAISDNITWIGPNAFLSCNSLKNVYCKGNVENWNHTLIEYDGNDSFFNASRYYYSDEPIYDGAHWHYDSDMVPTVWVKEQ